MQLSMGTSVVYYVNRCPYKFVISWLNSYQCEALRPS